MGESKALQGRTFAWRLLACLLAFSGLTGAARGERYALLVGIDKYEGADAIDKPASNGRTRASTPPKRTWPDLRGAVNDVEAIALVLEEFFAYRVDNIRVLRNGEATRDAILGAIDNLAKNVGAGDQVTFYYSGHGSQVRNQKSTEPDGLDESIVPADSRRGAKDIRDKELRRRFNRILDRGALLTVVLDSCHSGSGLRDPGWSQSRGVALSPRAIDDGADAGPRVEDRGALILSAARAGQTAHEKTYRKQAHGVFTLALLEALRGGEDRAAEEVFRRACGFIRAGRWAQTPTLLGDRAARRRTLFGGGAALRRTSPSIVVERVGSGEVALGGGWIHGLTIGSELAASEPARPRLRVTELQGLDRSLAECLDGGATLAEPVPGETYALASWAPPPGEPLRVAAPAIGDAAKAGVLFSGLREHAKNGAFVWLDDPVDTAPTHALIWAHGRWRLTNRRAGVLDLGVELEAAEVVEQLLQDDRLFVWIPPPERVIAAVTSSELVRRGSVVWTGHPSYAEYFLIGREREEDIEVAWLRADALDANLTASPLPVRSRWRRVNARDAPSLGVSRLVQDLRRIARVVGWTRLSSPPVDQFPYRLALRGAGPSPGTPAPLTEGPLQIGQRYEPILILADRQRSRAVPSRYVYVFVVDANGRGTLIFPRLGSVDNRFPAAVSKGPMIPLGPAARFEVGPPLGIDTYILLTTSEPIADPWLLEWDGVGTRSAPETALGRFLANTAAGSRGRVGAIRTQWSIEQLIVESIGMQTTTTY